MNHFYYVVEWNPTSSIIAMLDLSKNTTAYKAASISKESWSDYIYVSCCRVLKKIPGVINVSWIGVSITHFLKKNYGGTGGKYYTMLV